MALPQEQVVRFETVWEAERVRGLLQERQYT